MLRPTTARWLEVLCPRSTCIPVLAELARTGAVEVEVRPGVPQDLPVGELAAGLGQFTALEQRYWRYWARGRCQQPAQLTPPLTALTRALQRIAAWQAEADGLITTLQLEEEWEDQLRHLHHILQDMQSSPIDFDLLISAGPLLGSCCAVVPMDADPRLPDLCLWRGMPWEGERCLLVLGPAPALAEARARITGVKGRVIERPDWLKGNAVQALAAVEERRVVLEKGLAERYAALDALFERHGLGEALGGVASLRWFQTQVGALERASENLVWITGWTDAPEWVLVATLDGAAPAALLRLTPPPPGLIPPQVLSNPPWVRAFEPFTRALGMPGGDEADPTPILTLVVPLLFGYMFGDLGQGLVLLIVGLGLWGRFGFAPLLISGGLAASFFGLLFGSLFGLEDQIPALCAHPLEEPLGVLLVPLGFGALLLSLGQILRGLGAWWGGCGRDWLVGEAGFLMLYLGLVGTWWDGPGIWLAALGTLWYLAGAFWLHRHLSAVLAAVAHLLESGLQILVNTLSFARVGAFALAHAALSSAFVSLSEALDSGLTAGLVLLFGNLLVIGLEGLVVAIQTTRLVLFEFFVRFLQGKGRVLRPLIAPPKGMAAPGGVAP